MNHMRLSLIPLFLEHPEYASMFVQWQRSLPPRHDWPCNVIIARRSGWRRNTTSKSYLCLIISRNS